MALVFALLSIYLIAFLARLWNAVFPLRICPVCAGVAGTWLLMLLARWLGFAADPLLVAVLMGGSVVGVAYQLEAKLAPRRSGIWFKLLFIPLGFAAAYELLFFRWGWFFPAALALGVITWIFLSPFKKPPADENQKAARLEEELKNCC